MILRQYRPTDSEALLVLFFTTIRTINSGDYNQKQLEAWAPDLESWDTSKWKDSFNNKYVVVADDNGTQAGFGELEPNGHIDRFYIHHQYIGKGVGQLIYAALEQKAREDKITELFVEASITAKPFFEKMGFRLIKEQSVERRGEFLTNFVMRKSL